MSNLMILGNVLMGVFGFLVVVACIITGEYFCRYLNRQTDDR